MHEKAKNVGTMPELKEFLDKHYQLNSSENYEEFLLKLGTHKHTRKLALNSKPTVVLSQQKHQYILVTTYPEGRYVKVKFTPEEEIQRRRPAGRKTSSVFHIVENKLIEELIADDNKILIEREFKKRDLVVTMEVNDVKCYRFYKFVDPSKLSIATESSRRSSLLEKPEETELKPGETFKEKTEDDECDEIFCL